MQMINLWFHWLFSSPGYFLLALVGLLVCFGFIGGATHSQSAAETCDSYRDEGDQRVQDLGQSREDQHYQEWNAHQVRERHRIAASDRPLD